MIVSLLAIALATAVAVVYLGLWKGVLFVGTGLVLSGVTSFLGAFTGGWLTGRGGKERLGREQMTRSLLAGQIATAFLRGFLFAWLVLWMINREENPAFYGPLLILAWFWSLKVLGDLSLGYGLHFLGSKQRELMKKKLLKKRLEFLEANGRLQTRALAGTIGFVLVLAIATGWDYLKRR